ncbi:MAG TPA: hypothetical protein VLN47_10480 [Clostridiaceae bacterium]|nr:hypothetical protein [Clostridiaceae bacterium]
MSKDLACRTSICISILAWIQSVEADLPKPFIAFPGLFSYLELHSIRVIRAGYRVCRKLPAARWAKKHEEIPRRDSFRNKLSYNVKRRYKEVWETRLQGDRKAGSRMLIAKRISIPVVPHLQTEWRKD